MCIVSCAVAKSHNKLGKINQQKIVEFLLFYEELFVTAEIRINVCVEAIIMIHEARNFEFYW